jgi:hypothetical protein
MTALEHTQSHQFIFFVMSVTGLCPSDPLRVHHSFLDTLDCSAAWFSVFSVYPRLTFCFCLNFYPNAGLTWPVFQCLLPLTHAFESVLLAGFMWPGFQCLLPLYQAFEFLICFPKLEFYLA